MKCFKIFFLVMYIPSIVVADNVTDKESVQNIKKEYGVILDNVFAQGREKLKAKEDIIEWLYNKNQEEFPDIQNLMSDLSIELSFNRTDANIVKGQLRECLEKKIRDEIEKMGVMEEMTAENMQDFFYISGMVCDVTLEPDVACHAMMRKLKKENRSFVKKLKIVDKAETKIKKEEKKQQKKELLAQLREQILLGTSVRK